METRRARLVEDGGESVDRGTPSSTGSGPAAAYNIIIILYYTARRRTAVQQARRRIHLATGPL